MQPENKKTAYIALALVSFFWGTTYLATRIGVQYSHGVLLAAIRQLSAGGFLFLYCLIKGCKMPDKKTFLQVSFIGFVMITLSNGLMTWGMHYISSGMCAIMAAMGSLWVVFFSHFLIKKIQFNRQLVIALLVATVGIFCIFYENLGDFLNTDYIFGIAIVACAVATWSLGSVITSKWKPKIDLILGASLQMLVGGSFMAVIALFLGVENLFFKPFAWEYVYAIVYLVVFGSFVAYSAFLYTLNNLPATQASLYTYINPIVAVVLGWLILSEPLTWLTFVGMFLTLTGVYFTNKELDNIKKQM
jgi:drug/metabolite transporter (DMT)-like permease